MGNTMSSVDNYLVATGFVDIQTRPTRFHDERPIALELQPAFFIFNSHGSGTRRYCCLEPSETSRLRREQCLRKTGLQRSDADKATRDNICRRCTPRVIPVEIVFVSPVPRFERDCRAHLQHVEPPPVMLSRHQIERRLWPTEPVQRVEQILRAIDTASHAAGHEEV